VSAALADSVLFGHLWSTPEVRELFTDEGRTQGWLDVLAALAEAQADVGLLPVPVARDIRAGARVDRLNLARVGELTRATGHSTLGLIRVLQEVLPEPAREWVYYGATVQDVTDTWTALTLRRLAEICERDLARAERAALGLARRHRDTVLCGRTHGQPGLPVTLGFKAAVWADELRRHRVRVAQARPRVEVAQLGGALGTMEFWGPAALPLLAAFAGRLGLGVPELPWLTARDRVAEFVGLLALITGTLAKVGNEVVELSRPEIGELRERPVPGAVGSITMPHKRNPELSEHLCTLARVVRAQVPVVLEGLICEHERDGRSWKAEWAAVPAACTAAAAALAFGGRLLEGLEVDAGRMRANLDAQRGYVLSEPVLRALSDRLGKHRAHTVLYEATMAGLDAGLDLRAALRADPRLAAVPDAELDRLLDPVAALGAAPVFVDRVLAAAGGPLRPDAAGS
jgi:adenylosuccinate lyase